MQSIFALWRDLPWIVRLPLDFVVSVIIFRGILGQEITSWLKERGLVKEAKNSFTWKVLDFTYNSIMIVRNFIRDQILSTERKEIFWKHQVERHGERQIVCTKGKCELLG